MMIEVSNTVVGILPLQFSKQYKPATRKLKSFLVDSRPQGKALLISKLSKYCTLMPNNKVVVTGPTITRHDRTLQWHGGWAYQAKGTTITVRDSGYACSPYLSLAAMMEIVVDMIQNEHPCINNKDILRRDLVKKPNIPSSMTVIEEGGYGSWVETKSGVGREEWQHAHADKNKEVLLSAMRRDIDFLRHNLQGLLDFDPSEWTGYNVVCD